MIRIKIWILIFHELIWNPIINDYHLIAWQYPDKFESFEKCEIARSVQPRSNNQFRFCVEESKIKNSILLGTER